MREVPNSVFANRAAGSIRNVLDTAGNSLLVLLALQERRRRFMDLQRGLGDSTQRVLPETLPHLEADGYVVREVHPTVPPTVE